MRGDLRRPPLRTGAVGAVWSAAALLHVPRAEVSATLAQWRRVTRTGGQLALSTSLGDEDGWELVPYAADGGPPDEEPLRRWFVHHDAGALVGQVTAAGWRVDDVSFYDGARRWVRVRATAT